MKFQIEQLFYIGRLSFLIIINCFHLFIFWMGIWNSTCLDRQSVISSTANSLQHERGLRTISESTSYENSSWICDDFRLITFTLVKMRDLFDLSLGLFVMFPFLLEISKNIFWGKSRRNHVKLRTSVLTRKNW